MKEEHAGEEYLRFLFFVPLINFYNDHQVLMKENRPLRAFFFSSLTRMK